MRPLYTSVVSGNRDRWRNAQQLVWMTMRSVKAPRPNGLSQMPRECYAASPAAQV